MAGMLDIAPRPIDGYLMETEGGNWQVDARGATVGVYADEQLARLILSEHGDLPHWLVKRDGTYELIRR